MIRGEVWMETTLEEMYDYNQLADMIIENLKLEKNRVVGVTGTSCVGKSTFTKLLKSKIEEKGYSVLIIRADNYLKKEFRGASSFWTYADEFLKPEHFAWNILWQDILRLQSDEIVRKKCYVRGIGWKKYVCYKPADIIIVEGLFLDSFEASSDMQYNFCVSLTAPDELIRRRRMERDDYYREHYDDFKRTKEETLKETEDTLKAGKAYKKCMKEWNYLELLIKKDFHAVISRYYIK